MHLLFAYSLGLFCLGQKEICAKAARKMLVKMTCPVHNFISILQAAFVLIFFCQKIAKPNCN